MLITHTNRKICMKRERETKHKQGPRELGVPRVTDGKGSGIGEPCVFSTADSDPPLLPGRLGRLGRLGDLRAETVRTPLI